MTINQYLKDAIGKDSVLFEDFCGDELNSDTNTLKKQLVKRQFRFFREIQIKANYESYNFDNVIYRRLCYEK